VNLSVVSALSLCFHLGPPGPHIGAVTCSLGLAGDLLPPGQHKGALFRDRLGGRGIAPCMRRNVSDSEYGIISKRPGNNVLEDV
jgi:hypothetical protein